jgi:hypothetical protein
VTPERLAGNQRHWTRSPADAPAIDISHALRETLIYPAKTLKIESINTT